MRTLKTLTFATAVIGLAAGLPAASASASYHIASESGGSIEGGQVTQAEFKTDVGTVKCKTTTLSAFSVFETELTLTMKPNYGSCALAGVPAKVNTSACNYEFGLVTTTLGGSNDADLSVHCSGLVMTIEDLAGLGCRIDIGDQLPGGQVNFQNEEAGTVLATFEVTEITYSWTAACPNSEGKEGEAKNGTYSGSVRLEAENTELQAVAMKVT